VLVSLNAWRFVAILLSALAMGMKLAHALELPPKLAMPADLYLAVQTSLYGVFAIVGPIFEVGALLCVSITAFLVRRTPAFRCTLASVAAICVSLAVWLLFVLPANGHINQWAATQVIPPDWMRWRAQWQYGQAASFALHLLGFSALVYSVVREAVSGSNR
jgi:hypothetical protein